MAASWSQRDMPSQQGKLAIVTGANRGIGLELASGLAAAGASVVLACRDPLKAQAAMAAIKLRTPAAQLRALQVDLASLASIREFAATITAEYAQIDLLCHNAAAIMAPLSKTADGFEMHIGTNFLGMFALTGLLLPVLQAAPAARVVTTGSLAHRLNAGLDLDDPHFAHTLYKEMDAYGRSKLAILSYTFELDRRLRKQGSSLLAVSAHPGYTATNLDIGNFFLRLSTRLFAQKTAIGVLPALYAATATQVNGGDYIGPSGFKELSGPPRTVDASAQARDPQLATRLWDWAERSTGEHYPGL